MWYKFLELLKTEYLAIAIDYGPFDFSRTRSCNDRIETSMSHESKKGGAFCRQRSRIINGHAGEHRQTEKRVSKNEVFIFMANGKFAV